MATPAQLTLTAAWTSLGAGPLLVQVLSGSALVLESATLPGAGATDGTVVTTGAGVGTVSTKFPDSATYWAKGVATGSVITVTPLPSTSAGAASASGSSAPEQVSDLLLLAQIDETLGAPAQDATVQALKTALGTPAQDGTDVAGAVMPTGGVGIRGWLSAGYAKLCAIAASIAGTLTVGTPRVSGSGALGALNATVTLGVDGMSTAVIQVAGTFAGTLAWLASIDGGQTYFAISVKPFGGGLGGPSTASAAAPGQWELAVGAITHLQVKMTAWTSGTAAVLLAAANGGKIARVEAPASDPLPVAAAALPLPAGAMTDTTGKAIAASLTGPLTVSWSGQSVQVANYPAVQPVSAAALPLPAGAMADATGQSILSALQGQRAESLWTDDTGAYYIRVDKGGAIAWTDLSGNTLAAPGSGVRPAAGTTVLLSRSSFQATTAGTGYAANDYLDHFVTTDPSSGNVLGNFWVDLSTGAKLAGAPAAANITPVAPLPSGAATYAGQSAIRTALGTPFQAGGAIGNTAFGISGTLPAFAVTPMVNLGTLNGAATDATSQAIKTAIGSPFQAGGTIGNTAFGISGTLPAFAAPPTVNLGTLNGAATDATGQAIKTTLGSPFQAGGTIGNTAFGIAGSLPAFAATPTFNIGTTNGVSIADGGAVTLGSKADAAATSASMAGSVIAWLRGLFNALVVLTTPRAYTNQSGTTSATAGTFTQALAANGARQVVRISNPVGATGILYVYDKSGGTPTTTNSVTLSPGGSYTADKAVSGAAIQVAGSVANMPYEGAEGV